MNRATIAFTGSAFLILLGVINLQEAWEVIDPGTIFLTKYDDRQWVSYLFWFLWTCFIFISSSCQKSFRFTNYFLAAGSTLAGNLTLFGAVANLITSEAAQLSYKLTFWEYLRLGIPLTITTVIISYFWLS